MYGELPAEIRGSGHARAVGGACHATPLALIIPCHREVGPTARVGLTGGAE
ncbi:MAG: MGMT family protein [Desulfobacteraceae bacterium]|nr:MGMT family protein [Desulfobacteraceae bacterium]